MPATPANTKATMIPCLRYRDAPRAIEWLCAAFGFQQHLVVEGDDGTIAHAQLVFGNGMAMLASASGDTPYGKLVTQPRDIGGAQTQTVYVVVQDADAVYRSALAAGAEILMEIRDEDYGGRGFTCRDLEGHVWTFGTYDPFSLP